MPDPTNPNTPATTASNPMASAPSWEQFVNQYYRTPTGSPFGQALQQRGTWVPSQGNPIQWQRYGPFAGILNFSNSMNGWNELYASGLLADSGINSLDQWNIRQRTNEWQAEKAIQQAFKLWQSQQMQQQQQQQQQPPQSPDIASTQVNSHLGVLQNFAQQMPITNPSAAPSQTAPNFMQAAALLGAFASPMQNYAPVNNFNTMPWMFQYL